MMWLSYADSPRNTIPLEEARSAICYPPMYATYCSELIEKLRRAGITGLISYGDTLIGGVKVLGRGHAAVVVAALHQDLGLVAVKIRRFDSKRHSLEDEAKFLRLCEETRCVPRVYAWDRDFVIRELIPGPTLRKVLEEGGRDEVRRALTSLLVCAHRLDLLGVEVTEISLPLTQVVYRGGDTGRPVIVDLESARLTPSATNVTSVLGFVIGRSFRGTPIRSLMGIEKYVNTLRELARSYKRCGASRSCRTAIFSKITAVLSLAPG